MKLQLICHRRLDGEGVGGGFTPQSYCEVPGILKDAFPKSGDLSTYENDGKAWYDLDHKIMYAQCEQTFIGTNYHNNLRKTNIDFGNTSYKNLIFGQSEENDTSYWLSTRVIRSLYGNYYRNWLCDR